MKQCTKCILTETHPKLTFDADGICNYCRAHVKLEYLGEDKLSEDIAPFLDHKGKYNCLVPISGGKDSAYVLHQMHSVFKMRVLAFNYDNLLTHPQAQENVKSIADNLGVDLAVVRNEKQRKHLTTNLRAYIKKPSVAMVPMLCTGCRYGIIGNAFGLAKRLDIPLIAIGWSPIEDTPFKEAYLRGENGSVKQGLIRNLASNPAYVRWDNMIAAVKDYFHNYQHIKDWNFILKMLHPNVKLLQFYDYIPYHPDQIQQTVVERLGWRTPDARDSWQFDCKIKLLQNYFYGRDAGFTATDGYLSAMIREGYITRDEAAQRLAYSRQARIAGLDQLHEMLTGLGLGDLVPHFSGQ